MKKKLLSVVLATAMTTTLFAGCGKENTESQAETTSTNAEESTAVVEGEAIPDPVYYYSFDEADGTAGIQPIAQDTSADPILSPIDKEITFIPGVAGDSLYIDGVTGYKLSDVNGVGDTYTVSYWMYATRFSNYMPTIQFGPDIHGDATGGLHYLNITRAEWGKDGAATFPCIWAYDQLDNALWPHWAPDDDNQHFKEWVNITLVVDANNVSVEGTMLVAKLYVNGEEIYKLDSDKNVIPINVVNGCMAPSDNFDFLLGVNYWDSIFKGAIDELYIFDQALTAGQALTLYQKGDPNAAYEEPERVIEVTADPAAIESIGTIDQTVEFGSEFSSAYAIADGETLKINLKNWSDGKDSKNNYALMFTSSDDAAATFADESYEALLYADGTDAAGNEYLYSWGNWNTWNESVMVEADVNITIKRDGGVFTFTADNVDYNGTSNTTSGTIETSLTAEDPCNIFITAGNCYVDILSAKSMSASADGVVVGNTDCTTGWWTAFSDIWGVAEGESKTIGFTNYNDGGDNWHNFVAILQSTPEGHSADTEGYEEYAVVRADNFGWGAGYDGIVTPECDWNWDTFMSDMDGAHVDLTVTNNGSTADVVAVVTTLDGTVYTQKYAGIAVTGDVYFCLGCEAAYLVIDAAVVGNTDCTTGWWTAFSDIWGVAEGQSKTVNFTNYNDGGDNWHNFVAILQSTPEGHSADTEGYAEYAVVRADNFGWGTGYDGIVTPECDWNWDTFMADMDGANVALTVTNNGSTADVVAVVTTLDGTTYTQKYEGIEITGDLYFCLGCEASYLVIQ